MTINDSELVCSIRESSDIVELIVIFDVSTVSLVSQACVTSCMTNDSTVGGTDIDRMFPNPPGKTNAYTGDVYLNHWNNTK